MILERQVLSINPVDLEYQSLPEGLKLQYTRKEYEWLTKEGRERLVEQETMPEAYED